MSKVIILGTCRVSNAGVIVVGSNSGAIASIAHTGDGDDTVTLDADSQIGVGDTVQITQEGAVAGLTTVTRTSTLLFDVLQLDAAGAALAAPYCITIYKLLVG